MDDRIVFYECDNCSNLEDQPGKCYICAQKLKRRIFKQCDVCRSYFRSKELVEHRKEHYKGYQ